MILCRFNIIQVIRNVKYYPYIISKSVLSHYNIIQGIRNDTICHYNAIPDTSIFIILYL